MVLFLTVPISVAKVEKIWAFLYCFLETLYMVIVLRCSFIETLNIPPTYIQNDHFPASYNPA